MAIDIFRGDNKLAEKLNSLVNSDGAVFLSHITVCELFKGAFLYFNFNQKLAEVEEFIRYFEISPLSLNPSREFGRLYKKLKESGKLVPEFDLMIASIVKANNLTLITRDKKHFKNTGIKVEVW